MSEYYVDSITEYHLRTLVDRLTTALVPGGDVRVLPDNEWHSDPFQEPPTLWYRVADIAVLGEQVKAVTCREIGRLMYSQAADWTYDVSHNPHAAEIMLNVVETARVEMKMSQLYFGTRAIFDRYNGEQKPDGAWSNPQVKRDFPQLPVKWRFVLNMQRILNGMAPVGSGFEVSMVRDVEMDFTAAVQEETTQGVVSTLRPVYSRLLDAIAREEELREYQKYVRICKVCEVEPLDVEEWDDAGQPQAPPKPDPGASDSVSDFQHPPAEEDDGQPGGTDGSAGKRQHGQGLDGPDTGGAESSDSPQEGEGEGEDGSMDGVDRPGSLDDVPGVQPDRDPESEPSRSEGDEEGDDGDLEAGDGDSSDGHAPSSPATVKTGSIFREMVEDLPEGAGGKAVDNFRAWFRKIDREAQRVEKQIFDEREESMLRIAQGLGNESGRRTARVRRLADEGREIMEEVLPLLDPMIRAVRHHASTVLEDNARERWGGSYRTGRRLKRQSLHRVVTQDEPRVFERKRHVGGKSYCIAPCIDQSSSMEGDEIMLAAMATIVCLEGLEGLTDTASTGFFTRPPGPHWGESTVVHDYKRIEEPIERVRPLFAEMFKAEGSTPMGAGLMGVFDHVSVSDAEVRAIILVSDGVPTDGGLAEEAFKAIHKTSVQVHGLAIGGARPFHHKYCRRVIEVTESDQIVPGFIGLLHGIVRREWAFQA